jgi:outer membrane protein assembly factor BamB
MITLCDGGPSGPPVVSVEPIRDGETYVNVTALADIELKLIATEDGPIAGWTTWTIKVTLTNPSQVTGYDVWGIIYPPTSSAYIPFEHQDGLTDLFNSGMTSLFNPFKAFAKDVAHRAFQGNASHDVNYVICKNNSYKFVSMPYKVTASYPDNAGCAVGSFIYEPDGPIYPTGSDSDLQALLLDWQDNISTVQLDLAGLGIPNPVDMIKVGEEPSIHATFWRYHLTQNVGTPIGIRKCRLYAYDSTDTHVYGRDFEVAVQWDPDPPHWVDSGCNGIYDHIAGPNFLRLFFCEAADVSMPVQYAFHGNSDPSCFDGGTLKVVLSSDYTGYTDFSPPWGEMNWYGIRLIDAAGLETFSDECHPAARYGLEYRWTSPNYQPINQCGIERGAVLGDVNGDGVDDVVAAARDGIIYAWEGDGTGTENTLIWQYPTVGPITCCPALVDLNDDNHKDVVFGGSDSYVYALSGVDGSPLWSISTVVGEIVEGTPAIGQFNDGAWDVVIGTGTGRILALNGEDGSEIWHYDTGASIAGAPGVADVTGDSTPDVCFGSYDNNVYMLDGSDGSYIWNQDLGSALLNVASSPAMVDVNGDLVPDCIIGAMGTDSGSLYAFDGPTGDSIWSQDDLIGNPVRDPAPCMLNDDGIWDFIVTCLDAEVYSFYAINGLNGDILYAELLDGIEPIGYTDYTSPIVGDFTGDGHLDTVFAIDNGFLAMFNIGDFDLPGKQYGLFLSKAQVSVGPKLEITGPPAVGDVNGDGRLDLVVANQRGYVFILDLNAPVPDESLMPWSQNHGNRWHNGIPCFTLPD